MTEEFNPKTIKAIVGLGNPGKDYEQTYHNVGSLFIDYLKNKNGLPAKRKNKFFELYRLGNADLVKPALYMMNASGGTVIAVMKHLGHGPEEILFVHDDSDLNIGEYKLSFGSGSAGHKGVESVIQRLGTKNFWRLRIGIRPKTAGPRKKAGDFVLKRVSPANKKTLESVFERITADAGFNQN
jgi:PTH1 family peptidyl-tRNA hydrolase